MRQALCKGRAPGLLGGDILKEPYKNHAFSFEPQSTAAPAQGSPAVTAAAAAESSWDAGAAMSAAGVAAYRWTVGDDAINWSDNAQEVLGRDGEQIATGKSFAALLDAESFTGRYDAVMRSSHADLGHGVTFAIEYLLRPDGRGAPASIWIEDQGRWFAGTDGRPRVVLGTVRRINDRHRRDQQLSFLGNCDPLTGMMNRGRMAEALGEAISVAGREGTSCCLLLAAINNLGVVNEAFGFEIADEVIVSMGRRLRQVVRAGDAIARYSGSKFGIILNQCDEPALEVAIQRFLDMARESVIETAMGPVWALLSIGGLVLPQHGADANAAMARAEESLSEARRLPSDGYVVYRPSQERSEQRQINAHNASEIVRCLREDRFLLAFQPVVARDSGDASYHEALLRIRDASGKIITAGDLIPIAEKLGLVRLIDRAVVQMAVAALHRYPDARLAINISGTTATDPRWSPQIIQILEATPVIAKRMIIEITETVALSDIDATRQFAERLRELGCSVAIDDFGAGFTSFRNLRALPVDILKIDGNFCRNLSASADNQYFVRALIDLARAFNFKSVAEWVETEEDAALLREWQVDYLQGNLFGEASLTPPWPEAKNLLSGAVSETSAMIEDIEWLQPGQAAIANAVEAAAAGGAGPAAGVTQLQSSKAASAEPPIAAFESELEGELTKLRRAILVLDSTFKRQPSPAAPVNEPSFADLLSDTVLARAG